jgi:hypothetical protein
MLMGSQRFKLYICWITGLALHCVYFKRSLYVYIYMLDNWANPTSCLKYLESLFLYSISFNFLFSCSCRMAIFWCLTCAKPQGLLNPWRGFQATQFIPCIPFHIIQLFLLVLEQWCPHRQLAYVCGILVVLKKGEFKSSICVPFVFLLVRYLSNGLWIHWRSEFSWLPFLSILHTISVLWLE